MGIRIWHQSFADLSQLPGYAGMLRDHAAAAARPGTEVDVHGVMPGSYPTGIAPVQMHHYRYAQHILTMQVVENAVAAERQGYDAMALSCFIDPGVDPARGQVDIPVVSSLETSLILAGTVGRAFGLITLDPATAAAQRALVEAYGHGGRLFALEPLDPPLTEHDLDGAFAGDAGLVRRFRAHAERLVAAGADVIVPAEGLLNTLMVRHGLREVAGCPVLDSYGGLIGFTEALVGLARNSGLRPGRRGAYARPAGEVMAHVRAIGARTLQP